MSSLFFGANYSFQILHLNFITRNWSRFHNTQCKYIVESKHRTNRQQDPDTMAYV